jgi:hypothetical protein
MTALENLVGLRSPVVESIIPNAPDENPALAHAY